MSSSPVASSSRPSAPGSSSGSTSPPTPRFILPSPNGSTTAQGFKATPHDALQQTICALIYGLAHSTGKGEGARLISEAKRKMMHPMPGIGAYSLSQPIQLIPSEILSQALAHLGPALARPSTPPLKEESDIHSARSRSNSFDLREGLRLEINGELTRRGEQLKSWSEGEGWIKTPSTHPIWQAIVKYRIRTGKLTAAMDTLALHHLLSRLEGGEAVQPAPLYAELMVAFRPHMAPFFRQCLDYAAEYFPDTPLTIDRLSWSEFIEKGAQRELSPLFSSDHPFLQSNEYQEATLKEWSSSSLPACEGRKEEKPPKQKDWEANFTTHLSQELGRFAQMPKEKLPSLTELESFSSIMGMRLLGLALYTDSTLMTLFHSSSTVGMSGIAHLLDLSSSLREKKKLNEKEHLILTLSDSTWQTNMALWISEKTRSALLTSPSFWDRVALELSSTHHVWAPNPNTPHPFALIGLNDVYRMFEGDSAKWATLVINGHEISNTLQDRRTFFLELITGASELIGADIEGQADRALALLEKERAEGSSPDHMAELAQAIPTLPLLQSIAHSSWAPAELELRRRAPDLFNQTNPLYVKTNKEVRSRNTLRREGELIYVTHAKSFSILARTAIGPDFVKEIGTFSFRFEIAFKANGEIANYELTPIPEEFALEKGVEAETLDLFARYFAPLLR